MRAKGASLREIATALAGYGYNAPNGKPYYPESIKVMVGEREPTPRAIGSRSRQAPSVNKPAPVNKPPAPPPVKPPPVDNVRRTVNKIRVKKPRRTPVQQDGTYSGYPVHKQSFAMGLHSFPLEITECEPEALTLIAADIATAENAAQVAERFFDLGEAILQALLKKLALRKKR
jgi:hypothetical protein